MAHISRSGSSPLLLAFVGLAGAALLTGCATNLSTLQTADTVSMPGVRVGGGAGLYVPANAVMRDMRPGACEDGEDCDAGPLTTLQDIRDGRRDFDPTSADDRQMMRDVFRDAIGLALFPPAPMAEVSARTGLPGAMDAGVRWTPLSVRADVKKRLVNLGTRGSGLSLAVLGGAEYFTFDWFAGELQEYLQETHELLEFVSIGEDLSRIDGEVALIASVRLLGMVSPYVAAKYRAGRFQVPLTLRIEAPEVEDVQVDPFVHNEDITGWVHYVGGTVGVGLGHKILRFFAEVTAMTATSQAQVLDEDLDLGGLVVYPALGLAVEFP